MKVNKKRKEIKKALFWAAILLIASLLLKSIEGYDQLINYFILSGALIISLSLNGLINLSCKLESNKTKN